MSARLRHCLTLGERGALAALLLVTLVFGVSLARVVPLRLACPWAVAAIEPDCAAGALRAARGEVLYRDYIHERPILALPYGALFYESAGQTARVLGFSDPVRVLQTGRALTFGGFTLLAAVLVLLARQRGARWWLACLAPAPLLWFPYPFEWFTKFAPDAGALALSFAGWLVIGASRPLHRWRVALAIALWVAGFHFKPSVIPGQIAFAAEALAQGRRREAAAVWGAWCGAVVLSALALTLATGGLWKLHALDAMRGNGMRLANIPENVRTLQLAGAAVLAAMVLWAALGLRATPLGAAFLVSIALDLVLQLKRGSNVNYCLGSIALWGVAAVAATRTHHLEGRVQRVLAASLCVGGVLALALGARTASRDFFEVAVPSAGELERADAAVAAAGRENVLCLDGFYALARGLSAPYFTAFTASVFTDIGRLDFAAESALLRERRWTLVLSATTQRNDATLQGIPMNPWPIHEALTKNWVPEVLGPALVLWRPRGD